MIGMDQENFRLLRQCPVWAAALLLGLWAPLASAQDAEPGVNAQTEQQQEAPAASEAEPEQAAAPLAEADAAAGEPAPQPDPQQSDGRFIPTEQISQDLGVSFPVDI